MSDGRTWGTIIGGVVGFFTGGIGFAAGAAIGGAIGGLLEPKKRTETNRIDDITVSASKYGDAIPETYGNGRPPLTWVWSTYIIQLPEEPTGGKGGGVENTNYRQFMHGLLCFGKTPPPGSTVTLRKLWIDGKLNYDASSGLSAGQALATEENPWQELILLPGFDDQLPWPLLEIYEGIGNAPAFRGRITGAIYGLECPGGRIPQIQAELCIDAEIVPITVYGDVFTIPPQAVGSLPMHSRVNGLPIKIFTEDVLSAPGGGSSQKLLNVYALDETYLTKLTTLTLDMAGNIEAMGGCADIDAICAATFTQTGSYSGTLSIIDESGSVREMRCGTDFHARYGGAMWGKWGSRVVVKEDVADGTGKIALFDFVSGSMLDQITDASVTYLWVTDGYVFCKRNVGGTFHIDVRNDQDLDLIATQVLPPALQTGMFGSPQEDASLVVVAQTTMDVWEIKPDASISHIGTGLGSVGGDARNPIQFKNDKVIGWNGVAATARIFLADLGVLTPVEADVGEFIEGQALRSGLSAGQVDTSDVSDSFWGLTINRPSSARDRVAPVMTYSALGVVEEDGLLRYFRRAGKTSVATIAYEELAFAEDGSEQGDPFPVVHANAQELPRSITISYNDPNFDYQTSTVKAMRYAVDSVLDETQTLDMNISGDRAASAARRLLFERWLAQNTRSLAVSRKYAYLSAGDVITVLSKTGSYGDWMTSKITDTGARIEIECFPADRDLVIQTVPGPVNFPAQQIQPLPAPLQAVILDTPILRDQDNDPGLYVALDSYAPVPASGELFVGNSDDSLSPSGIVSASAPIGFAETALADWQRNLVDETNLVTVDIGDDVFSSITREQLLIGSENLWALGAPGRWEIGKSRSGSSLGDGRYVLSGHLRGLFGTERCAALHRANDTFVLLRPAGMLRPAMGVGDLGLSKKYRAIALGRSFNSAASQSYANTGEGLMPLSPVNLRRAFASRDLNVDRRSRLTMNNSTGAVPLGEAVESYLWKFYTDGTYATLIGSLLTASATITAAQQSAIGVTPTATAYVQVAQVSDSVGAGHALQAAA